MREQLSKIWRWVGLQLYYELPNAPLGKASIEQSGQERKWCQPGYRESCQPNDLEPRKLERAGKHESGQHDQCEAKAVDQDLSRSPPLPPWQRSPPPPKQPDAD